MKLTTEEFNRKYKDYIENGFYGLDISHPKVVDYLDRVFERLENFKIFQIKLKFGVARVYLDDQNAELATMLEQDIDSIIKYYNNPFPERINIKL